MGLTVGVEVAVGAGVSVRVAVGRLEVGSIVPAGAVTGTVALIMKFWFGGHVTGTLAGMTMGPLQAVRMAIEISAKRTWPIFIDSSF